MTETTIFKSDDGFTFSKKEDCLKHEIKCELKRNLKEFFDDFIIDGNDIDTFQMFLLKSDMHIEKLHTVLNIYMEHLKKIIKDKIKEIEQNG